MVNKVIFIRVDDKAYNKVKREAEQLGLSMAGFIRLLISGYFDEVRFTRKTEN